MNRLIQPRIEGPQAAAAASADDWHERIVKYVPVEIASTYPVVENLIQGFLNKGQSVLGFQPSIFAWLIFIIFLILNFCYLRRTYKKKIGNPARKKIMVPHLIFSSVAFVLWTYVIRSAIWLPWFDAGLSIIFTIIFILVAGIYQPVITTDEAKESGLTSPQKKE